MITYILFGIAVLILVFLVYFKPNQKQSPAVPGLYPTDKENGNLQEIAKEGSLHEFLIKLHKQFGDIASFWMGQQYIVSICSPELFKEHLHVFDRPVVLFKLFEPFIGPKCIQYANKEDGKNRRQAYDQAFSHESIKHYYQEFQEMADATLNKWMSLAEDDHVPVSEYMADYALKCGLLSMFGKENATDQEIAEFHLNYQICWNEMEQRLTDFPDQDSPRIKAFNEALSKCKSYAQRAVQSRKEIDTQGFPLLIDILIENATDEETLISDAIAYIVGGFHTTANALTWCIYFLASHLDVQEKLFQEIKRVLGDDNADYHNVDSLLYMHQVIDETFRCSVLAPWAARFQEEDSEIGGYHIPKNTPVIHALGVSLQNEKYWPSPQKFEPERFNPENMKDKPTFAFQPFGFAGKRKCPGYRFTYAEQFVLLSTLFRKFKVTMVDGQNVAPVHGLVTHPNEEIWIKLEKRDK